MPTHRSLNKLEYKAHMSIHNFINVSAEDGSVDSSTYTRDRFGKKHDLSKGDNRVRMVGRHVFLGSSLLAAMMLVSAGAAWADASAGPIQKRGPNVQVSSSDPEVVSVDSWMNRDDRPVFYQDGPTSMGFNENGDPSLSTRF